MAKYSGHYDNRETSASERIFLRRNFLSVILSQLSGILLSVSKRFIAQRFFYLDGKFYSDWPSRTTFLDWVLIVEQTLSPWTDFKRKSPVFRDECLKLSNDILISVNEIQIVQTTSLGLIHA